jgi:MATE family multidrug resistance protein
MLRLAVPIALANLTVPVVGLVDIAMLGHLSSLSQLAGVALASILFDYLYWAFGFLRMGTTGLVAQALGAGRDDEAQRVLWRAVVVALAHSGAILIARIGIELVGFAALAGELDVEAAGREYFGARIWGAPAALTNFAFLGWFLGNGHVRRVLFITVVGNGANVILDYVFIYRLGLGAAGAGYATAIAQYGMLAMGIAFILHERPAMSLARQALSELQPYRSLLLLNGDIFVRTLCLLTSFAVFANVGAIAGSAVLAANAILMKLLDVAAYGIDGLSLAAESLAGRFKGKGDHAAIRKVLQIGLVWGEVIAVALIVFMLVFDEWVYAGLTSHEEVIELALRYQPGLFLALIFGAAAYVYDGVLIGLTEGRVLRNGMLISTGLVFVPIAFASWWFESNALLWVALTLFMVARVVTLASAKVWRLPAT